MNNQKQLNAISALLIMLLYLIPNLVQDVHRVFGHKYYFIENTTSKRAKIDNQQEKCIVCVFEFNVVDEISNTSFVPLMHTTPFQFTSKRESQIQNIAFHYYNLRAPPQALFF